jgi:hypothetical protein
VVSGERCLAYCSSWNTNMSGRTQAQVTSPRVSRPTTTPHSIHISTLLFTSLHFPSPPFTTIMHCSVCMHRPPSTLSAEQVCVHGMNLRRDAKQLHPSPILLRALCQRRGLLQAETPPSSPSSAPPPLVRCPHLPPNSTHSRLTSERWCLRSEDPVGFFIHLHSTVFCQVDFCSFSIYLRKHRRRYGWSCELMAWGPLICNFYIP